LRFARVFTSPLQRASRTCELADFGSVATIDRDLVEWNYGEYEGLTPEQNQPAPVRTADLPRWLPRGESVAEVAGRADWVVKRTRAIDGNVLLFFSGHFLHVLAARWIGLEPGAGRYFYLGTPL
jgi:probable phosphoglycerate mutase